MVAETWLLIFDNVDAAKDVQSYIPTTGHGAVIITTRDRDVADSLSQRSKDIELLGLQETDAADLLSKIAPGVVNNSLSRTILDDLGRLPLAIYQMGSYIRQTGCPLERFRDMLKTTSRSSRFFSDTESMVSLTYDRTLAASCDISIRELSKEMLHLLGVLSFFQVDDIQEGLITCGCQKIPDLTYLAEPFDWDRTIARLTKHSMVTILNTESGRSLRMHRVIKFRALQALESAHSSTASTFRDATTLLHDRFPRRPMDGGTMTKSSKACEMWLPHVLSLKENFASLPQTQAIPESYVEVLCDCAWFMWERGAEHGFDVIAHALELGERLLQNDNPLLSDIYTIVGCFKLVDYQAREECTAAFQKAVDIRVRYMAKITEPGLADRRQMANVHNNVGATLLLGEHWEEAMSSFNKSLALKRTFGNENTIPYDIAVSLYNICRVQMGQGRLDEAKSNAKRALDLAERANDAEDFRTLQFQYTYADLLVASGEIDEGLEMHKHTLKTRKRVLGEVNNDTGVSYYGLSCVYQRLGRLDEAL